MDFKQNCSLRSFQDGVHVESVGEGKVQLPWQNADAPQVPSHDDMDTDDIPNIQMVVLDGIVMGPQVNDL